MTGTRIFSSSARGTTRGRAPTRAAQQPPGPAYRPAGRRRHIPRWRTTDGGHDEGGIPLYVHPGTNSRAWAALSADDQPVSWVVVNQNSGPGSPEDTVLTAAAKAVGSGAVLCGYIEHNYGAVLDFDMKGQAQEWVSRGIAGAFIDRVSSDAADVQDVARTVLHLREAGIAYVVLNCGTVPAPAVVDLADVVVTFEGSMAAYRALTLPDWLTALQPERTAHLIYEAAADEAVEAVGLARRRGCHHVYATSATFASGNPWSTLPDYWPRTVAALTRYPSRSTHVWPR
ncbi:spherulation-specific family 4 protein [Streptomyces sp. NPDC032472]|uniref:spherulation-specific family 4 protein n=1 Tax=Streptomyces sp. NPDC032472 TaxID=3155018 RepID=UPI0033DE180E